MEKSQRLEHRNSDTPIADADTSPQRDYLQSRVRLLREAQANPSFGTDPREIQPRDAATELAALRVLHSAGEGASRQALQAAVLNADVPLVQAALAAGVPATGRFGHGHGTLDAATMGCTVALSRGKRAQDVVQVIDLLVAAGARPSGNDNPNALAAAAQQCPGEVVQRLLAAGAARDARTATDFSALDLALTANNLSAARALVDAGARTTARRVDQIFLEPPTDPETMELLRRATAGGARSAPSTPHRKR